MKSPLYVGEVYFASYNAAAAYCDLKKLSYTLIHHEPYKLPKKLKVK